MTETRHQTSSILRKNYLSGYELTFQSLGTVAPSAVMALLLPVIFATSGTGTWVVFVFAAMTVLLLATQMNIFARRMASPGALYVYVNAGLGPLMGMIAGWSVLLGYVFFIATIPALIYNLLSSLLRSYFDIASGLYLELAIMALAVFIPSTLARRDVRLSTRLTAIIEISTMTLIVFLLAAHFWHKGGLIDPEQLSLRDFTFNQFHLGLVLAFVCFGGFESAMDLGSEARQPLASLPRVLTVVVGVLCLFFVFVAYGLVDAFHGVDPALDKQESPLTALAQILHLNALGLFITIGVLSSMMASALGCINAASRILYTLSHRGMVHRGAGKIHSRYATPARSITIVALIGFALALILTLCGVAPLDAMNYFSTIGGFGILSAYLLVALAAPFYLKKRGELRPPHIFFSVITVLLLLVPLVGSLYPAPDYPMNVLPYIFLAVIALGIGYFLHIRRKDPQRLQSVETELLARD